MRLFCLYCLLHVAVGGFQPPSGVRFDTTESYLLSHGMVKCYDVPYSYPTYESFLSPCADASWVFVGAKYSTSDNGFFIGAFGLAVDVFRYTNSPTKAYQANGVYWYKVHNFAFGFAGVEDIFLNRADLGSSHSKSRLSWHYNFDYHGGYRAGEHDWLNDNDVFRKVIYRLPSGLAGQPTVAPTISLPGCSVPNEEYLGDGYCDSGIYNTAVCDYDRGDCCASTCIDGNYMCGIVGYDCKEPTVETAAPSMSPSASQQSSISPTIVPTNSASVEPTLLPSIYPSTPSVSPSMIPSTMPSTSQPTSNPSIHPTIAPTPAIHSKFIYQIAFDSDRPYYSTQNVTKLFQFPNMTSFTRDDLYFTTITFSESTKLREDLDYITIYRDSLKSDVYGEERYTGTHFPGMNGEAALGFRDFRFVFHFHSSDGFIPEDSGYMMNVIITRYADAADIPKESPSASKDGDDTHLGLSRATMTAVFSVVVVVSACACCCLLFWYKRAVSTEKVACDEALFDRRLQEHREDLRRIQMTAKKGKASKLSTAEEDKGQHNAVPLQYLCPISCEIMEDPVICSDGYTYDRTSIEMWLRAHGTSPMTNAPVKDNVMIPNLAMKEIIRSFTELSV